MIMCYIPYHHIWYIYIHWVDFYGKCVVNIPCLDGMGILFVETNKFGIHALQNFNQTFEVEG